MALTSAMLETLQRELGAWFSKDRVRADVVLAPFTTFKVGGPADLLFEPRSGAEFATALDIAHAAGVPFTVLGGGSNVLIGDHGIRGLVLRTRGGAIVIEAPLRVRADAAVTVNELVRWTVGRGLSGLEAWAGTPGTVGGGVYGNAHWGGRLLGGVIESVRLWQAGVVSDVRADEMEFGYDRSRLQRTGEVLLSARFVMGSGDAAVLRTVARQSLAYRKRTQPLHVPSAGCIFQNPGEDEAVPDGIPRSAGALVDHAGLKGVRIGAAVVSPTHANFIVNEGGATASEIRTLVERCRAVVHERFGVRLRDEIVCVGEFGPQTEASSVHAAH
jgi:UDP-N-acetylmuramate dehydrogenase